MSGLDRPVIRHSPATGGGPDVWGIYDPQSGSIQYVCADPETRRAAVIDPVWNYDTRRARLSDESASQVLDLIAAQGLALAWILDTHPHADHVSAADLLRGRTGAPTATGDRVPQVARLWEGLYGLAGRLDPARHYDRLLRPGDSLPLGGCRIEVMASPGHTLASVSYRCGDAVFAHDTLMQPDAGTARTDFPGGSAEALWDSIAAILALPPETRVFVGHDYGTRTRCHPEWEARVADHRAHNIHVGAGAARAEWIARRRQRDATLALPERMLVALQINLRGGCPPPPEADGHSYLRIPLNRF